MLRSVVYLKDGDIEQTEPMSEEVARETYAALQPVIRIIRNENKMVRVGQNLDVRAGLIEMTKARPG